MQSISIAALALLAFASVMSPSFLVGIDCDGGMVELAQHEDEFTGRCAIIESI
jgi:hypothetical protein